MQYSKAILTLWQALAIFLVIGAGAGVIVSLILIFKPSTIGRINQIANRWVSVNHVTEWSDRTISLERWFYRNHIVMGLLITLGGAYMLAYYGFWFDRAAALHHLPASPRYQVLFETLIQACQWFAIGGAVVALVTGVLVCLRPSLLRGFEDKANRWVSTNKVAEAIDVPHFEVDVAVLNHPQKVGWILLVGSIFVVFLALRWLL